MLAIMAATCRQDSHTHSFVTEGLVWVHHRSVFVQVGGVNAVGNPGGAAPVKEDIQAWINVFGAEHSIVKDLVCNMVA